MKIALFTSNQLRHAALAKRLRRVTDEMVVVSECKGYKSMPQNFPSDLGEADILDRYFSKMLEAEYEVFSGYENSFSCDRVVCLKFGDLSKIELARLSFALDADVFIVFGCSHIKGKLAEFLIARDALNLHIGLSPYYRGSACNFWAIKDSNLGYVGATIHKLTSGIDDGQILRHCLPKFVPNESSSIFAMKAVSAGIEGLVHIIKSQQLASATECAMLQDMSKVLRFSKKADFTAHVALDFLRNISSTGLSAPRYPDLVDPFFN